MKWIILSVKWVFAAILMFSVFTSCNKELEIHVESDHQSSPSPVITDMANIADSLTINHNLNVDNEELSTESEPPSPDKENDEEDIMVSNNPITVIDNTQSEQSEIEPNKMLLPPDNSRPRTESVTHVVIHSISNVANNLSDPYDIDDIFNVFVEYGVSSHYLIDRDGQLYLLVPEERVAFHAGKGSLPDFPEYDNALNDFSIGIELLAIGTREEMMYVLSAKEYDIVNPAHIGYTDAQYETMRLLLNEIFDRHPDVKKDRRHVIGHDEYAPDRKTDPGALFDWSRIGF